jgi:hypothetical protein
LLWVLDSRTWYTPGSPLPSISMLQVHCSMSPYSTPCNSSQHQEVHCLMQEDSILCYSAGARKPAPPSAPRFFPLHCAPRNPGLPSQSRSARSYSEGGKAVNFTTRTMHGARCPACFSIMKAAETPGAKAEVHHI